MKLLALTLLVCVSTVAQEQFVPLAPRDEQFTSTLTGIVTDATGRPVANAPVLALAGGDQVTESRATFTDHDGLFSFASLADGYWSVSIDDVRYAREWDYERAIRFPADAESMPVRIELAEPQTFTGTLVDEMGAAVPEATVILYIEWPEGTEKFIQGGLEHELQTTKTDERGHFTLHRLRPGKISLIFEHPNYAHTRTNPIDFANQHDPLTIHTGLRLTGSVTAVGGPVAGANVIVETGSLGGRSMGVYEALTDANGRFEVQRVPDWRHYIETSPFAQYYVRVEDDRWRSDIYELYQYKVAVVPEPEIEALPNVGADFEPARVAVGKMANNGASPGTSVRVSLDPPIEMNEHPYARIQIWSADEREKVFHAFVDLDGSGNAVFDAVPAGEYTVHTHGMRKFHYAPVTFSVREDETPHIVMKPGVSSLTGRIVGAEEETRKHYVSWFRADAPYSPGEQGGAEIHPDGSYEATGLNPGEYRLVYEGDGIMRNEFRTTLAPGVNRFDLVLPAGGVDGRLVGVTIREREEWEIATVTLLPSRTTVMTGNLTGRTDPDEDGVFRFDHVPPGRYRVSYRDRHAERQLTSETFVVASSGRVTTEIAPPARVGEIRGRVVNMTGANEPEEDDFGEQYISAIPLESYGYEFAQGFGASIEEESGEFAIKSLSLGTYGLFVFPNNGLPAMWIPGVEVRDGLANVRDIVIPESRNMKITLDGGGLRPGAVWYLRYEDGTVVKYDYFIGGSGDDYAYPRKFRLPLGNYLLEADFEAGEPVTQLIEVESGDGVQEFNVRHPALADERVTRLND